MHLNLEHVNWLAVITAGIATFILGGVWYMALFGKTWQRLHGYSDDKVKQMQAAKPPPVFFGTMILSYLVLAAVIAILMSTFGIATLSGGIAFGALLWIGPALCIGATSWIASDRHIGVYVIDLSYQLCFLLMIGAILGAWH